MDGSHIWRLALACLAAETFSVGCFLVIGEIPEGSRTGAGGDAAADEGSAGSLSSDAATECPQTTCDCDGDGYGTIGCAAGTNNDCDDSDPDAFPGQSEYFDHPRNDGSGSYDYNCDDKIDAKFTQALTCSVALIDCPDPTTEGYLDGIPQCGELGDFGYCKQDKLQCVKVSLSPVRQKCH